MGFSPERSKLAARYRRRHRRWRKETKLFDASHRKFRPNQYPSLLLQETTAGQRSEPVKVIAVTPVRTSAIRPGPFESQSIRHSRDSPARRHGPTIATHDKLRQTKTMETATSTSERIAARVGLNPAIGTKITHVKLSRNASLPQHRNQKAHTAPP